MKKIEKNCSEEENSVTIEEIAEMLQQLDDHGVRTVDPTKRSLNIIGERHEIAEQDIPVINATIPDITDIPDGIKVLFKPKQKKNNNKEKDINEETDQSEPMSFSQRSK